ncbi:MAG: PD-(D/E)XK nuclease superfamily protein [Candidatus Nanopusillus acidilobi]
MTPGGKGTRTGTIMERMIASALESNNYKFKKQVYIGQQLFGNRYKADFIVNDKIISLKWQQVPGTAEQKIIYEIASLIKIIEDSNKEFTKAYLVYGGNGFSQGALNYMQHNMHVKLLIHGNYVFIESLNDFIARINQHNL